MVAQSVTPTEAQPEKATRELPGGYPNFGEVLNTIETSYYGYTVTGWDRRVTSGYDRVVVEVCRGFIGFQYQKALDENLREMGYKVKAASANKIVIQKV